jgi:RNA polymerase sigma-70 factor (ECF subfamily)
VTADCETTFKQWLGEHTGLILRIARSYGNTAEDQDDLFQEICLQLWLSVPRFEGKAKVSTWIYRVALNTALVWNRGEKRRRKHNNRLTMFPVVQNSTGKSDEDEIVERLYEAIRKLPKVDASVVLMHLDGLAYSEMSEILDISESNVGVKLNRAKKQLALLLDGLIDDF